MTKLVNFESKLDRLWRDYIEKRRIAEKSDDIRDGLAMGRAFGAWHREFVIEPNRAAEKARGNAQG